MRRILFPILMLLCTLPSFAQDVNVQRRRKEKIEQEIAQIDRQLNANRSKRQKSVNSLILTKKKIEARKDLISQIESDIHRYNSEIISRNAEIARLSDRLDTLTAYHSRMVHNAYKMRDTRVWFMYLLTSKDFSQGLRRWSYLKNISRTVSEQAKAIEETRFNLQYEKSKLETLKTDSENSKQAKVREYRVLTSEEQKVNRMISELSREEKKMKSDLKRKREEIERLNREIERILTRVVKDQKTATGKSKVNYALSSKFVENKGKLPWPVDNGVVIQRFGQSFHPVFKNLKLPFNNGINISARSGSRAQCVFDGVVKQILVMPGYNQCVLIQHGEYFTFYCKLKMVTVKSGDKVRTGESIGLIDSNGDGNAEIHFQLWKGTTKQNPEYWLRKK